MSSDMEMTQAILQKSDALGYDVRVQRRSRLIQYNARNRENGEVFVSKAGPGQEQQTICQLARLVRLDLKDRMVDEG